jgi:hypothetical protein
MSNLRKEIGLKREKIELLPIPEALKEFLRDMVDDLEENYKDIYDHAEAGGMGLTNWRIKEDGANCVVQKLEDGTWTTKWTFTP